MNAVFGSRSSTFDRLKVVVSFLSFLFCLTMLPAQVGINTNNPNKLTELDIRNLTDAGGNLIPKGIMIPRMTGDQRDAIDVSTDPDMADGLMIFNTDEDCYNYYSKQQEAWISLCGQDQKSEFSVVQCNDIKVNGRYGGNIPLTSANYLSVPVSVSQTGEYSISAKPVDPNGFYFDLGGNFLSSGSYTIKVPGFGIPADTSATSEGDEFIILINKIEACRVNVWVQDARSFPEFTISCNTIAVNGAYVANVPLTEDNTLSVTIRASASAIGSFYSIVTDTVNGYSFSGSGTITQSLQTVTLMGSGTPLTNSQDMFLLTSNSIAASNTSCETLVKVATRAMTVVGLGDVTAYYLASGASSLNCMYSLLTNTRLFGPTQSSVYAISSINIPTASPVAPGSAANVANIISQVNPDVIIVQYSWTASAAGAIAALQAFVNNGGVLIYCSDGDAANLGRTKIAQDLVWAVFNTSTLTGTSAVQGNDLQLLTDASINQGPFQNISGQYMVRDAAYNFTFTGFANEPNATVISWYDAGKTQARAFMHNTKGFVLIGDGGPFGGNSINSTTPTANPMVINSDYYPVTGVPVGGKPTYNSFLFCNIMAWAFDYVQRNRP